MSKVLVASYSRGGTTRILADEVVQALGADFHNIEDVQSREGALGYLRSAVESFTKGVPSIHRGCVPGKYDLVVLGTPVWTGTMSSPMRSFLFTHAQEIQQVACFCTMGGRGAKNTLEEMIGLTGSPYAPTFSATESDVLKNRHDMSEFIESLKQLVASTSSATAVA